MNQNEFLRWAPQEESFYNRLPALVKNGEKRDDVVRNLVDAWTRQFKSLDDALKPISEGGALLEGVRFEDEQDVDQSGAPKQIDLGDVLRQVEARLRTEGFKDDSDSAQGRYILLYGCCIDRCNCNGVVVRPTLEVVGTLFRGEPSFHGTRFGHGTSFIHCQFPAETRFESARFGDRAQFSFARFGDRVNFINATFKEQASFIHAAFGDEARFDASTFQDDARFGSVLMADMASFCGSTFGKQADFKRAVIGYHSRFTNARFGAGAAFTWATFAGGSQFDGAEFEASAMFQCVKFNDGASFLQASFGDRTTFNQALFGSHIYFEQTRFGEMVDFANSILAGTVSFARTAFPASFRFFPAPCRMSKGLGDALVGNDDARDPRWNQPKRSLRSQLVARARRAVQWELVRSVGALQALTRVSYVALLIVPLLGGVWAAVQNFLQSTGSTLPVQEPIKMASGWVLAFFAALFVTIGHLLYQVRGPQLIREGTRDDLVNARRREFSESTGQTRNDLLQRAFEPRPKLATVRPWDRHPALVRRFDETVWLPTSLREFQKLVEIEKEEAKAEAPAAEATESSADVSRKQPWRFTTEEMAMVIVDEGARAAYDLAARENIWSARCAAVFYGIGSWLVAWLTLQQSAAVLSAGFGWGTEPVRWVDRIMLALTVALLVLTGVVGLLWRWPWARRVLKLDVAAAAP